MNPGTPRTRVLGLGAVLSLIVSGACGTRTGEQAAPAGPEAPQSLTSDVASVPTEDVADVTPDGATAPTMAGAAGTPVASGGRKGGPGSASRTPGAAGARPPAAGTSGAMSESGGRGDEEKGTAGPDAAPTPGPGRGGGVPAPAGGGGPRSKVVLASVGTYSGPAGTVFVPLLQGAQLWVRSINDRGGLNGHSVKLVVHDDGGDSARHRAALQRAVEGEKAIGFLMNADAITGQAGAAYITSKRVPVIGTTGGSVWAGSSPMYFPQMANDGSFRRDLRSVDRFPHRAQGQGEARHGGVHRGPLLR